MEIHIKNSGDTIKFKTKTTPEEILKQINLKNKEKIIIPAINGEPIYWREEISKDVEIEFLDFSSEKAREVFWHTASHIMAQAVKRIYPDAKLGIGPAIENGFYYDFDIETTISDSDLPKIEEEIKNIINDDYEIIRKKLKKEEAIKLFKEKKEDYKIELVEEIEAEEVTIYEQGEFVDLCRGPHLLSTGKCGVIKLLKTAGAYWRGDERNKMLQRIYGTAWQTEKELEKYLNFLKEAEARDHRKLGKQLDLFSIQEEIGPGLILWHPAGAMVRHLIETFWKEEHLKRGYQFVYTPHIARSNLWKISGHLENYKEFIYPPMQIEHQEYILKPMNCPFHIMIFKSKIRSYKDLPIRWAEMGTVYRYERSGVLHGMLRVRGFTQDDAHIFCTEEQLEEEITEVLELAFYMLNKFGFKEFEVMLSTRPEKYAGTDEIWEKATTSLIDALKKKGIEYKVDPGGGVFYGPKIDIKLKDALGRLWQGPTIQVDFVLPEKFDVNYIGADGREHRVVMVHRAVLGSLERFMGTLIEHFKGAFPLWLAPTQVIIIPVSSEMVDYAEKIDNLLKEKGIRSIVDTKSGTMGNRVREAITSKVPYIFIVGKREKEAEKVSIRGYREGDMGVWDLKKAIEFIVNKNIEKEVDN